MSMGFRGFSRPLALYRRDQGIAGREEVAMSTKTETLRPERRSGLGLKEWTVVGTIGAVAVSALVVAVLALRTGAPATTSHGATARTATGHEAQPVTGTGPDLAVVGENALMGRIAQESEPVTGTGPDLAIVGEDALMGRIAQQSEPVTGTGPGLAVVGENALMGRIAQESEPITGTGPDLAFVADHS
jgi:hypothetical protein